MHLKGLVNSKTIRRIKLEKELDPFSLDFMEKEDKIAKLKAEIDEILGKTSTKCPLGKEYLTLLSICIKKKSKTRLEYYYSLLSTTISKGNN